MNESNIFFKLTMVNYLVPLHVYVRKYVYFSIPSTITWGYMVLIAVTLSCHGNLAEVPLN